MNETKLAIELQREIDYFQKELLPGKFSDINEEEWNIDETILEAEMQRLIKQSKNFHSDKNQRPKRSSCPGGVGSYGFNTYNFLTFMLQVFNGVVNVVNNINNNINNNNDNSQNTVTANSDSISSNSNSANTVQVILPPGGKRKKRNVLNDKSFHNLMDIQSFTAQYLIHILNKVRHKITFHHLKIIDLTEINNIGSSSNTSRTRRRKFPHDNLVSQFQYCLFVKEVVEEIGIIEVFWPVSGEMQSMNKFDCYNTFHNIKRN